MSAELVLAVLGLVDGCIKLANKAISTYRVYCVAEQDLNNKVLMLETHWIRIEAQLEFLKRIKHHLTDNLAQCHFDLVQKLHGTLLRAISEVEIAASSIGTKSNKLSSLFQVGRWKYALRKSLDSLMTELDMWRRLFDPSWYLILLIGGKMLDPVLEASHNSSVKPGNCLSSSRSPLESMLALRQAIEEGQQTESTGLQNPSCVEYNASQLLDAREVRIPYSAAKAIFRQESGQVLIIEPVDLSASTASKNTVAAVEHLARKLQHVDPDAFGLLCCDGVLKQTATVRGEYRLKALKIIYRAPIGTSGTPTTLRQLLLDQPRVSLSAIIQLAKQVVRSVSYIHACDFVHKNIRPECILIFPKTSSAAAAAASNTTQTLGDAFLLGLSQFRPAHHHTNLAGDVAWHRNLYRHPTRQGLCILEKYVMQHDIYALGVCLLEIGLWRTLVAYPSPAMDTSARPGQDEAGESERDERWVELMPAPGFALELRRVLTDKDFKHAHLAGTTTWVKEDLVKMARGLLPHRMGELYTDIVVDCLTCLDEGNDAFGGLDENIASRGTGGGRCGEDRQAGIVVGVRFVERILAKITDISV